MIRIAIADDHAVVREGVKRILADTRDLQIVGEARTGQELFAIVAGQPCDVVLLDLLLPDQSGLEVLHKLKQRFPTLPVVLFRVQPEMQYGVRALKAGAAGYLTKSSLPQALVRAIRKVARGRGRYVSAALAEHLLAEVGEEDSTPLHTRLSNREFTVLCGTAAGKTLKELAAELSVNPKTIATYRARTLQKLHLKTTAELIRYALSHQLVD
jgi:DNA-binding NarL/FixJ family response regulator